MKTIGTFIKETRTRKKISYEALEEKTKIKKDFLIALEKEDWKNLPEYPVTNGFVKNIAKALLIDENKAVAVLRRDYPPKTLPINPKPDVGGKFSWSPKLTFLLGVLLVTLAITSYLGIQYINYMRSPKITVFSPEDNAKVQVGTIVVSGKTDSDTTIIINNQPVIVSEDGNFSTELMVEQNTKSVDIVAKSRFGKESLVIRKIEVVE